AFGVVPFLKPVRQDEADADVVGAGQDVPQESLLLGRSGRRGRPCAVDGVVGLLAVDGHLPGTDDAEADLVAADLHDGQGDVAVEDDTFVPLAGDDQHGRPSGSDSFDLAILPTGGPTAWSAHLSLVNLSPTRRGRSIRTNHTRAEAGGRA